MKGFQLQQTDYDWGIKRVGTHRRVYKTRWGAWLALIAEGGWFFGESWRVVPTPEPIEVTSDMDGVMSDFEDRFKEIK